MVDGTFWCRIGNVEPGENPGLPLKSWRKLTAPYRSRERNGGALEDERKGGEKRCYKRQDEGTRILFKAEHFTAARSAGGNGGSSATPEELIRG